MRSIIVLLISFYSCQQIHAQQNVDTASKEKWLQGRNNLQYNIVNSGSGKQLRYGNYMQMHIKQVYVGTTDSLLMDTRDYYPRTQVFDSVSTPIEYYDILRHLKTGDSLTIKIPTENLLKDKSQVMPVFIKKGDYIYTIVNLLDVFGSKEVADSASAATVKMARPRIYAAQLAAIEKEIAAKKSKIDADGKLIEAFLLRNKIKAQRTKWGTYVAVTKEGIGKQVDQNCKVTVKYTSKIMKTGRVVDSNTLPFF